MYYLDNIMSHNYVGRYVYNFFEKKINYCIFSVTDQYDFYCTR